MKYSGHRKLSCELSKLSKCNAFNLFGYLTNTDAIYSCLQIPPRENWFQYIHRVYATAINFPCITTLMSPNPESTLRGLYIGCIEGGVKGKALGKRERGHWEKEKEKRKKKKE